MNRRDEERRLNLGRIQKKLNERKLNMERASCTFLIHTPPAPPAIMLGMGWQAPTLIRSGLSHPGHCSVYDSGFPNAPLVASLSNYCLVIDLAECV